MTVTAHAGAYGTEENTLASVNEIIKHEGEIDIIELDVTFRPDGTPVIIHADEAKDGQGESFDEALRIIAEESTLKVNLDLKNFTGEWLKTVGELVKKHNLGDRAFFTGVDAKNMQIVRESCPEIPYYMNCKIFVSSKRNIDSLIDKIKTGGAVGANMCHECCSKPFAKAVHDNGLLLSIWTCNDAKSVKKAKGLGADNITSRKPDIEGLGTSSNA